MKIFPEKGISATRRNKKTDKKEGNFLDVRPLKKIFEAKAPKKAAKNKTPGAPKGVNKKIISNEPIDAPTRSKKYNLLTFFLSKDNKMEIAKPEKKNGAMIERKMMARYTHVISRSNRLTSKGTQMIIKRLKMAIKEKPKEKTATFLAWFSVEARCGYKKRKTPATPNPNRAVDTIKKA